MGLETALMLIFIVGFACFYFGIREGRRQMFERLKDQIH
jgi:hypothetical protein